MLGFIARWPRAIIALVVGDRASAPLTRLPFFGGEFLPEFREGHFVLQVFAAPGTSLPEMLRIGTRISEELLAEPDTSPPSSSRSAAPSWAKTPGDRTAASSTWT